MHLTRVARTRPTPCLEAWEYSTLKANSVRSNSNLSNDIMAPQKATPRQHIHAAGVLCSGLQSQLPMTCMLLEFLGCKIRRGRLTLVVLRGLAELAHEGVDFGVHGHLVLIADGVLSQKVKFDMIVLQHLHILHLHRRTPACFFTIIM